MMQPTDQSTTQPRSQPASQQASPATDTQSNFGFFDKILEAKRLTLTITFIVCMVGLLSYLTMARQEDPFFPYRAGTITVPFPGADVNRIERLVVKPLEEELAQVEDVKDIKTTVRAGVAISVIQFKDYVYDTDARWDDVDAAIEQAIQQFPEGVLTPEVDDLLISTPTVTYSVTGDVDVMVLADAAERLKQALLGLNGLLYVKTYGDPGEQVTIALDDAVLSRTGLTPNFVAQQLQQRSQILPGGSVVLAGNSVSLRPQTDFRSLAEIRDTNIELPAGDNLPLGSIARVWRGPAEPPTERIWHDGVRAVAVGASMKPNVTNVAAFGEQAQTIVANLQQQLIAEGSELQIQPLFFQPALTEERLSNLTFSMVLAVGIILMVLLLAMGFRVGIIVAVILPAVTLATLAVYNFGGGTLHQIAIIGIVVSLGILVDNAIVMVEQIQHKLDQGIAAKLAASLSIRELIGPLGSATGTTLAAFVPLLLAKGGTADFTKAIPIMLMLSLIISYIFALLVTPILAAWLLKPSQALAGDLTVTERIGRFTGTMGVKHPWVMTLLSIVFIGVAGVFAMFMKVQFFPNADRNQMVMEMNLPEGTHLDATEAAAAELELALRRRPEVLAVHRFVGDSGPRFYYNLLGASRAPQHARLVIETTSLEANVSLAKWSRQYAAIQLPNAQFVAKILGQGPPVSSPIEVRVFSEDPVQLAARTEQVFALLANIQGTADVTQNLGLGSPTVRYEINDAVASRYGLSRQDVALALLGRTHGLIVGEYRGGADPAPIRVRSRAGERFDLNKLNTINVYNNRGEVVPLAQVATPVIEWQPSAIHHHDQRRVATVSSQLADGAVFSKIYAELEPQLQALGWQEGFEYGFGGEKESSGEANSALITTAPIGIALLLVFLLLQFNSFVRLNIVLLTIPLAFVGVFPGLVLSGSAFGFQPLLGIIMLMGIVVNNAIVLLDVLDQRLKDGASLSAAVIEAVQRRTRPILLTTATTVAGLLPLALSNELSVLMPDLFSPSTLWPPMAWAIISGLLASTLLTIFLLPAVCYLMLWYTVPKDQRKTPNSLSEERHNNTGRLNMGQHKRKKLTPTSMGSLLVLIVGAGFLPIADAGTLTLQQAMDVAETRGEVLAAQARARAAADRATVVSRFGYLPQLEVSAFQARSNAASTSTFAIPTPNGPITQTVTFAEKDREGITVALNQPLVNVANWFYQAPAEAANQRAAELAASRQKQQARALAAETFLNALVLDAQAEAADSLVASLESRVQKINNLVSGGRVLASEGLRVQLARDNAAQQALELRSAASLARYELARVMGNSEASMNRLLVPAVILWPELPMTDTVLLKAWQARLDLQAIQAQIDSLQLQSEGVYATALPTINGQIKYSNTEGIANQPDEETQTAISLNWTPFAAATRVPQSSALAEQAATVAAERQEAKMAVRVQLEQARQDYLIAEGLQQLALTAVDSANATLSTRSARFDAGRANIDDVLEAEAEVANQNANATVANYQRIRAWLRWQLAIGEQPDLPSDADAMPLEP